MPPKKKGREPVADQAKKAGLVHAGQKRPADAIVPVMPINIAGAPVVAVGEKKRVLFRRDSEERITRAIGSKLDAFPEDCDAPLNLCGARMDFPYIRPLRRS